MYFQFRVDDHDDNKASALLKRYAAKHNGKFLLSKEVGSQTGKPHLQGFCFCTAEPPAYKQFFSRAYPEHGTHGKCFTPVKKLDVYLSYLVNNDSKTKPLFSDLITNYTEDEYEDLTKDLVPFTTKSSYKKSYFDQTFEALEKECVIDGIIQYPQLMKVFMANAPKKVNSRVLYDMLVGYTIHLEYRYPSNNKARHRVYNEMCRIDDNLGIFQTTNNSYLKFND